MRATSRCCSRVGYAACHWCHVMAHESFEDPATAALMNENFVNIKVDREERPDVDAVYMEAVQAHDRARRLAHDCAPRPPTASRSTPAPTSRRNRGTACRPSRRCSPRSPIPGGPAAARSEQRPGHHRQARRPRALAALAAPGRRPRTTSTRPSHGLADDVRPACAPGSAARRSSRRPCVLEFLLRHHARTGSRAGSRDGRPRRSRRWRAAACTTSSAAASPATPSTPTGWCRTSRRCCTTTPCCFACTRTGGARRASPLAERVVAETAEFLLRDLRTEQGGFASALDADTDGVEGLTYVWTPAQLVEVLGAEDGAWAAELLEVTAAGTFEHGASVLQLLTDPDAGRRRALGAVRAELFEARGRATPAGARRQGGRGLERSGDRRARRGRRAVRPSRTGSRPRWLRPTCSSAVHLGCRRPRRPGRCAGVEGRTRGPPRRRPRGPGRCRRGPPRAVRGDRRREWLTLPARCWTTVLGALRRRKRRLLRHGRRRRAAAAAPAGPDRQRDAVWPCGSRRRPAQRTRRLHGLEPAPRGRGGGARGLRARWPGRTRASRAGGWPSPRQRWTVRVRSPWSAGPDDPGFRGAAGVALPARRRPGWSSPSGSDAGRASSVPLLVGPGSSTAGPRRTCAAGSSATSDHDGRAGPSAGRPTVRPRRTA